MGLRRLLKGAAASILSSPGQCSTPSQIGASHDCPPQTPSNRQDAKVEDWQRHYEDAAKTHINWEHFYEDAAYNSDIVRRVIGGLIEDKKAITLSECPLVMAFTSDVPFRLRSDVVSLELERLGRPNDRCVISYFEPAEWSRIVVAPREEWRRVCVTEGWDEASGEPPRLSEDNTRGQRSLSSRLRPHLP